MNKQNTLFLDFDGVLFNTLKEAYLICRSAFSDINTDILIDKKKYQQFYKFKFLVYNSWQYYYLMKTLLDEDNVTNEEIINKYNFYLMNRDTNAEKEFDEKYYSTRKYLKDNCFDFWDSLEEPFDFFFEVKKLYDEKKIDIIIVSKKDFNSIKYRLSQYGLNLFDNKIFAKEQLQNYPNKSDFISEYMKNNNIKKAIFVDDNSNNLRPCKDIVGLETLLAGWGNIAIDETGFTCYDIMSKIKTLS